MVTARSEPDVVVECLRLQANDFISKPIIFEVALARVAAQIDRKIAAEEATTANVALRAANEQLQRTTEDLNRASSQLRALTYQDDLTGLPNRRWFNDRLAAAFAESDPHRIGGILLIDLDGFKSVNDAFGHSVGDRLLVEIATDLRESLGNEGEVARLSGDEFVVVSARVRPDDLAALAKRLMTTIATSRSVHANEVSLGASIGIAQALAFSSAEALISAADFAMYQAKASGRRSFAFFDRAMHDQRSDRQKLIDDLRFALDRNQLRLHYQPLVDARTLRVTGFEALMRWQHPSRGMIEPSRFIPLAEETGLIVQMGGWAIQQACHQAAKLPGDQRIAVNVSPAQFRQPGLDLQVASAIAETQLDPRRLEIEITEALLIDESESTLDTIRSLKAMGVRLTLDDFGVGYSSLSYLRKLPFDKIKIDRSFVAELVADAKSRSIVRAISQMANALGMTVTVEGVETSEQAELLSQIGCDELQGYLFSRPMAGHMLAQIPLGYQGEPFVLRQAC